MTQPNTARIITAGPQIALAACAFDLPTLADGEGATLVEMQLTPAGAFRPSDGRTMTVPAWRIDAQIAERVIASYRQRTNPAVVDYEHQTLYRQENGQPAPAAAWIKELRWHEGRGLFALVELTARAAAAIRAGEYRYVSPVFRFDQVTGNLLAIEMAAITNTPAIDGMEPLALRAAATFGTTLENPPMTMKSILLAGLGAALALSTDATEEQALAACTAKLSELDKLRQALGIDPATDTQGAIAACSSLRTQASATPDPAKFVPVSVVEEMKGELAALSAKTKSREVSELVEQGLADGRLLPAQKDWASSMDVAALSAYLNATPAIAALTATQTKGKDPAGGTGNGAKLTAEELAVCNATGLTPAEFNAAR